MESVKLLKHTETDVANRRFKYLCEINQSITKDLWFPWCIVGHTFPYRYNPGDEIAVSYYGDRWQDTVDWIGSIKE